MLISSIRKRVVVLVKLHFVVMKTKQLTTFLDTMQIIVLIILLVNRISLAEFKLPLIGSFYATHATRALQSHDLSGERIKLWIKYILF